MYFPKKVYTNHFIMETNYIYVQNKNGKYQTHVQVINHILIILRLKKLNVTEPEYHNNRDIESITIFPNTDPNIELTHWKHVLCYFQQCPPFYLTDK